MKGNGKGAWQLDERSPQPNVDHDSRTGRQNSGHCQQLATRGNNTARPAAGSHLHGQPSADLPILLAHAVVQSTLARATPVEPRHDLRAVSQVSTAVCATQPVPGLWLCPALRLLPMVAQSAAAPCADRSSISLILGPTSSSCCLEEMTPMRCPSGSSTNRKPGSESSHQ